MAKVKIVAVFGESAAGKDTLIKNLCSSKYKSSFHNIISSTTRPPREGEKDGIDYHFLKEGQFLLKIIDNEMLCAKEFNDWYYGISKEDLVTDKINIGVFSIGTIENLSIDYSPLVIDLIPVYLETPAKERMFRSLNRENNPDIKEICRRFLADNDDFDWVHDNKLPQLFEFNKVSNLNDLIDMLNNHNLVNTNGDIVL